MNILTIDTVLNKTYLSVSFSGKEIFKTIESDEKNYHSAYLIKVLSEILSENNLKVSDFDYIGTNTGVGSFTGIRVGLSVVKILSNAANIKIIPLNTIAILSLAYKNKNIMIDARRRSVFYSNDGLNIKLIKYEEAVEIIKNSEPTFVCDNSFLNNFSNYKDRLVSYETENVDLSRFELELTKRKIEEGIGLDCNQLKPTYIQTPPIFSKA